MVLHPNTKSAIEQNKHKVSDDLLKEINKLLTLYDSYSALSSFSLVVEQHPTVFHQLSFKDNHWMPTRNVVRLIAKLMSNVTDIIQSIQLSSMGCGCDYFSGTMRYTNTDDITHEIDYKWQWSAFPERIRDYNRFIKFEDKLLTSLN